MTTISKSRRSCACRLAIAAATVAAALRAGITTETRGVAIRSGQQKAPIFTGAFEKITLRRENVSRFFGRFAFGGSFIRFGGGGFLDDFFFRSHNARGDRGTGLSDKGNEHFAVELHGHALGQV